MVIDHTFNFNHVLLKLILLVVQGCIYPWYSTSHVLQCLCLLDIVDSSHFSIFVGTMSILVVSLTAPTLNGCLPWPLSPYHNHYGSLKPGFP